MQQQDRDPNKPKPNNGARVNGRRFTPEQRQHALMLYASGVSAREVARLVGTTDKSVRTWAREARAQGTLPEVPVVSQQPEETTTASEEATPPTETAEPTATTAESELIDPPGATAESDLGNLPTAPLGRRSIYAPKDPGQGLADYEKEAIIDLKRRHPSYGPAQIRAQLKRFNGWRVNIKAIAKVLRDNGYPLVHRGSRPEGPEPVRFEAPRRNALWQVDFAEMRIVGEKLYLCVMCDDFSRYVVGHALTEHATSEVAIEVLQKAMARHGKPEALRTDRGGAFISKDFANILEAEVIDHVVGRPYHPQGGGKVESIIGTVRRELWDVEQFDDREHALQRTGEFFDDYNERRAHMGIDGLTPADRYFGRGDRVLAAVNASSRKRNGASPVLGHAFEELIPASLQTPTEVLRLVLLNGKMELRFCGARVELGSIEGV
jgi:putative transposase